MFFFFLPLYDQFKYRLKIHMWQEMEGLGLLDKGSLAIRELYVSAFDEVMVGFPKALGKMVLDCIMVDFVCQRTRRRYLVAGKWIEWRTRDLWRPLYIHGVGDRWELVCTRFGEELVEPDITLHDLHNVAVPGTHLPSSQFFEEARRFLRLQFNLDVAKFLSNLHNSRDYVRSLVDGRILFPELKEAFRVAVEVYKNRSEWLILEAVRFVKENQQRIKEHDNSIFSSATHPFLQSINSDAVIKTFRSLELRNLWTLLEPLIHLTQLFAQLQTMELDPKNCC